MTSTILPKRRFLAEPVEISSRSSRTSPSDHSNASSSPSPSATSESTDASMAVLTPPTLSASAQALHKLAAEHIENTTMTDVEMTDAPMTNGLSQIKHTDDRKMWQSSIQPSVDSNPKPKRKFAPQPLETSTRSSKQEPGNKVSTSPKRKFAPEPMETSSRSSKSTSVKEDEGSTRPRRKFAVEPIDTKVLSSRDRAKKMEDTESKPKRRFAPEPMETSTRSSKDKEQDDKPVKPRRKFAVEQIETSSSSSTSRRKKDDSGNLETPSRSSSGGRKFSPELIETAKASYRKKLATPPRLLTPEHGGDDGSWSAPEPTESRFSAANLAKRARADPRRHSYCIPDLPIIPSDSSEDEDSGVPATPGGFSQGPRTNHDWTARPRHHHDHTHADHLAQMKTLREQAVAAYGDQEDLIPFAHYGGDSEDEDYSLNMGELSIHDGADPSLFRRMSHSDLHLVVQDLRHHHDRLDRAKKELQEDTAGVSRFSAAALAARHHLGIHHPTTHLQAIEEDEKKNEPKKEDAEFAQMRKAASPPMQGEDVKFPFSISPKMTRCDTDQAPRPRRRNSEEDEEYDIGIEDLWSAHVAVTKSPVSAGLWGGLCQKDENGPLRPTTPLRSGLQTPAYEATNPFEPRTPGRGARTPGTKTPGSKTPKHGAGGRLWGSAFLPLTPPRSKNEKTIDTFASALDEKLNLERQIDIEFHPRVITQIYNYLSLGYPPIARPFDEELSKISRISLAELRKGDRSLTGTMKGHIGVPEGEGEGEEDDDGRVKGCRRWDALRVYVREWARQSPGFAVDQNINKIGTGMWGNNAPVRKGSWGF